MEIIHELNGYVFLKEDDLNLISEEVANILLDKHYE